jgi:hypothetical protein
LYQLVQPIITQVLDIEIVDEWLWSSNWQADLVPLTLARLDSFASSEQASRARECSLDILLKGNLFAASYTTCAG